MIDARDAPRRHALRRRQRVAAPVLYWQVTGDPSVDAAGKRLALAFGLDHIVIDRERPEAIRRETLYTSNTAVRRGKPAITVESGGMGLTDEASVARAGGGRALA